MLFRATLFVFLLAVVKCAIVEKSGHRPTQWNPNPCIDSRSGKIIYVGVESAVGSGNATLRIISSMDGVNWITEQVPVIPASKTYCAFGRAGFVVAVNFKDFLEHATVVLNYQAGYWHSQRLLHDITSLYTDYNGTYYMPLNTPWTQISYVNISSDGITWIQGDWLWFYKMTEYALDYDPRYIVQDAIHNYSVTKGFDVAQIHYATSINSRLIVATRVVRSTSTAYEDKIMIIALKTQPKPKIDELCLIPQIDGFFRYISYDPMTNIYYAQIVHDVYAETGNYYFSAFSFGNWSNWKVYPSLNLAVTRYKKLWLGVEFSNGNIMLNYNVDPTIPLWMPATL